jgi:pilus assembly protein FimV
MMAFTQGGQALTLGNVRGTVLVGKPVNVTVPVTLDPGESPASTCTEVEISFADARIDASRIRTSWLPADAKGDTSLRIQSTIAVDEPMINIWLRAGCSRKSERRFVLLADVVTEPTPSGPVAMEAFANTPPVVSAGTQVPLVQADPVKHPPPMLATASPEKATSGPAAAKKPRKEPASTVATAKPESIKSAAEPKPVKAAPVVLPIPDESGKPVLPPVAAKPVLAVAQGANPKDETLVAKPRLRLEGLPDVNQALKTSLSLAAAPTEDLQARENARAMWRSLNASPDDLANIAKRLAALESEAKALKDGKAKVQADQDALKSQLERAEEDRYSNWLVGLLGALFVGASAIAGFLWWRSREKRGWSPKDLWHGGDSIEPSNLSDLAPVDSGMSGAMPMSGRPAQRARRVGAPDVDLGVDESLFDSLKSSAIHSIQASSRMGPPSSTNGRGAFVHSMSTRTVNVEELFDIQQQAEFFVSLGQHEQAIELLRQHIYTNTSTSGIAYLDLLKIYHDLERRGEYEQLREEFNQSFNAKVPPFDQFGKQQRRGLERYPSAIARIEALWKSPRILAILQEAIFRRPEAGDAECFDLEAYRELLLLFSIAKEVSGVSSGVTTAGHKPKPSYVDSQSADHAPDVTEPEVPQPGPKRRASKSRSSKSFENSVSVNTGEEEIPFPKASPRLALDVDLFELESVLPGDKSIPGPGGSTALSGSELVELSAVEPHSVRVASTMNAGLTEQVDSTPPLPPLDFSLSLPAEFSTPSPAPAMSPKASTPPSSSSLALDLNKYMAQKDIKSPAGKS